VTPNRKARPDRKATLQPPFYGWIVVAAAFLINFISGPGQSFSFSVIIDPIIAETGISRTLLSGLYTGGTAVSAIMTLIVGRLVDRTGARRMLVVVAIVFGLSCIGLAQAQGAPGFFLGFAGLRALGQGSLPVIATLLTAQWFVRYRGRAMAIVNLGFAFSNALFPPMTQALVDRLGWRGSYTVLAGLIWLLLFVVVLLVRNRPEDTGTFPDGAAEPPASEQPLEPGVQETGMPTMRTPAFWLLVLPLSAGPFIITALVFHQASIFAERGLGPALSAGAFVPFAVATAIMALIGGFLIERFGPKRVLLVNLLLMSLGVAGLNLVRDPISATIYAIVLGAAAGVQSVTQGVAWATYYGRRGLGRLQGSAAMVMITAAALAPLPIAAIEQAAGGYGPALLLMTILPLICFAILLRFRPPQP
jgi:MFS family permease